MRINPEMVEDVLKTIGDVEGCTFVLCHPEQTEEIAMDAFIESINERIESLKGNRSGDTPVTWADIRYLFALVLRHCLNELENNVDPLE